MTRFLPNDAIIRKRDIDIWCKEKYNKSWRRHLHLIRKVSKILERKKNGEVKNKKREMILPSYLRIKANSIVSDYHPNNWFYKWNGNSKNPWRKSVCPTRINSWISVFIYNWELSYQQRNLQETIEENHEYSEIECTKINPSITKCIMMHCSSKKYTCHDRQNQKQLQIMQCSTM